MAWRVALIAPLLVLAAAALLFVPFLTEEREVIVFSPQPPPLFDTSRIQFQAGETVCAGPVPLSAATDVARVVAARSTAPTPSTLRVVVRAPGYESARTFARYENGESLGVPLPDPAGPVDGEVCVENVGDREGLLYGSNEARTVGRLTTTTDGRPSEANMIVSLVAAEPASVWGRRGEIAEHAAEIGPSFAPPWVLWAASALVVVGIPAGVALALRLTPSDDRDQP